MESKMVEKCAIEEPTAFFFEAINPFTMAIKSHMDFSVVRQLLFSSSFLSGILLLIIHIVVIFTSVVLWPYGLIYVFCILMGRKIASTVMLLQSSYTGAEYIAHGFSLLIFYVPLFLIFGLTSLPLFGINYCAGKISRDPTVIGRAFIFLIIVAVGLSIVAAIIGLLVAFVMYVVLPIVAILAVLAIIGTIFSK